MVPRGSVGGWATPHGCCFSDGVGEGRADLRLRADLPTKYGADRTHGATTSLTDNAPFAGTLFNDPHWFAEGFDARTGAFRFVATDRAALAAQTFLDER